MRIRILIPAIALAFSTSVFASSANAMSHGEDGEHKHDMQEAEETHDHAGHDHKDAAGQQVEHKDHIDKDGDKSDNLARIADTPEIKTALEAGGEAIVADVLGVVCDFCAKAMNKTFGKRDEVAAVFVDLDTKALSLVLKPDATLDDETITKLVKKAGYKTAAIRRGDAALGEAAALTVNGDGDATDPS